MTRWFFPPWNGGEGFLESNSRPEYRKESFFRHDFSWFLPPLLRDSQNPQLLPDGHDLPTAEWALVQRILATPAFSRSDFLSRFLIYICDRKLRGREDEITEYKIGTQALGRPDSFHTGEDNIVRNYARLLRKSLADYFGNAGSHEEMVIEIPKGRYFPVFERRDAGSWSHDPTNGPGLEAAPPLQPAQAAAPPKKRPLHTIWQLAALLVALVCLAGAVMFATHWHRSEDDAAIDRFWGPFWSASSPLVIFSNALFIGDQATGMRYAASMTGSDTGQYVDTYTGVGEVSAVYDLTRLFQSHHAEFTLKRSLLVTWDEARKSNLIFIGSVANNPALRVIPADSMDFIITADNGFSAIQNRHPKSGEPQIYARLQNPLTRDYAIVALMPGLEPGRKMLVFSGLTTFGTQAAVEFGCSPDGVEQLLRAASGPYGTVRPFEAIIQTTIGGNVPLQSRLVAIHVH